MTGKRAPGPVARWLEDTCRDVPFLLWLSSYRDCLEAWSPAGSLRLSLSELSLPLAHEHPAFPRYRQSLRQAGLSAEDFGLERCAEGLPCVDMYSQPKTPERLPHELWASLRDDSARTTVGGRGVEDSDAPIERRQSRSELPRSGYPQDRGVGGPFTCFILVLETR